MAKKKVPELTSFDKILTQQIDALINESEQEVDVITFVESPHYLNVTLHGVEKFILKVFYGIRLDDTTPYIQVRFFPHDDVGTLMTEVEYALFLMEQKRINIMDLNFKAAQHLLLVCGRRGGKCVKKNSYLYTVDGMVQIQDLAKNEKPDEHSNLKIDVVQETGKITSSDMFYNGGIKPVINIKTSFGYEIGATFNHRIKVMHSNGNIDWKYMEDIEIGDRVCINRKNNIWPDKPYQIDYKWDEKKLHKKINIPTSNVLDEKMALLLGAFVGDGTWTEEGVLQLRIGHHQENDFIQYSENLFDEIFGYHCKQVNKDGNVLVSIHSVEYRKFFDYIGYTLKPYKRTKKIPWIILRERKSIVAKFLSGLFETDGGVESDRKVCINSDSIELIHQVQLMLLNFGIISSRKIKYNKKYKQNYYILSIGGYRNLKIFNDEIGFVSKYNKDRFNKYFSKVKPDNTSIDNQDVIPYQKQRMNEFWKENKTSRKNRDLVRHVAYGEYDLSYTKLNKLLVEFNVPQHYFQYIKDCDYYFDEVVEITTSKEQVYDLHIPDGNMYVSNGFMSHNTFIAALICAYESYLLISKGNPQKHYKLTPGQKIKIITVATNGDQAKIASDMIRTIILQSPWLSKFCDGFNQNSIRLRTKWEYDNNLEPSVFVEAMTCSGPGIRGHTAIVAILDELAHFTDSHGVRGGDSVYYSLTPSIATFGSDGKILALSNPYAKTGIFYTQYVKAMGNEVEPPLQHIRAFKIPTWEMNETLNFQFFKNEYELNPESFDYEYGAEFAGAITGFFKFPDKIDDCINYSLIEKPRPLNLKTVHWLALDPAAVGNGYALCMVHTEERKTELGVKKIIVVDRWRRWLASDEEFADLGLDLIDPSVIDEYILDLSKYFKIGKIRYDQFESASSVTKLVKAGLAAERKPITASYNMDIYKNLRNLIYNNEIELLDHPIGINELRWLQEKKLANGRFRVDAPLTGETTTDDMADVLAVAAYMALESDIINTTTSLMGLSGGKLVTSLNRKNVPSGMKKYQKQLAMQNMRSKISSNYRNR
jgi:intein/homing endonuclease